MGSEQGLEREWKWAEWRGGQWVVCWAEWIWVRAVGRVEVRHAQCLDKCTLRLTFILTLPTLVYLHCQSKSPSLSLPPITSFAWNGISPERIVSCSIDTTATLWDIETTKAVTQLIAHDRAVYDL